MVADGALASPPLEEELELVELDVLEEVELLDELELLDVAEFSELFPESPPQAVKNKAFKVKNNIFADPFIVWRPSESQEIRFIH